MSASLPSLDLVRIWVLVSLLLCCGGIVARAAPAALVPLAGDWLVAVPAGFQQPQTITHLDGNRYRLSRLNHAGVYRLEGDRLIMEAPADPRLTEFVWRLRPDGTLVLIGEPPASKTGAHYLGMVMRPAGATMPSAAPRAGAAGARHSAAPAAPPHTARAIPLGHSTGGSF